MQGIFGDNLMALIISNYEKQPMIKHIKVCLISRGRTGNKKQNYDWNITKTISSKS